MEKLRNLAAEGSMRHKSREAKMKLDREGGGQGNQVRVKFLKF